MLGASAISQAPISALGTIYVRSAFTAVGLSSFLAYSVTPTPSARIALVPLVSRGLLLARDSRLQPIAASAREVVPFGIPRTILVPIYPRIDMPLNWPSKDPDELLDYSLNWSQALAGDTIVNSDWQISDPALIENHATNTSTATVIWLEAGVLNQTYLVTNTIETAGGRTFQQSVNIRILAN